MKQLVCLPLLFLMTLQGEVNHVSRTKLLFNGRNLHGWHTDVPAMDTIPGATSPFIVRNGILVDLGKPTGHLITNDIYKNYRLEVQYRFPSNPGNSGVLLHVSDPRIIYGIFPRSIEAQLQHGKAGNLNCMGEDITVPDMEARRGPKNLWGTTPDKRFQIKHLVDKENPPGEWNTMIVECVQDSIKIWMNEVLVNEGYNCTTQKGRIALQSEGTEIEFRKIALTPVKKM